MQKWLVRYLQGHSNSERGIQKFLEAMLSVVARLAVCSYFILNRDSALWIFALYGLPQYSEEEEEEGWVHLFTSKEHSSLHLYPIKLNLLRTNLIPEPLQSVNLICFEPFISVVNVFIADFWWRTCSRVVWLRQQIDTEKKREKKEEKEKI